MDKLLSPLNGAAPSLDDATRLKLQDGLREAAENLETPYDTMLRFFNAGRQLSMLKIGYDLGIFKTLCASQTPVTIQSLCSEKGCDPVLVRRIMRWFAANRIVKEISKDEFAANKTTAALIDRRVEGGLVYFYHIGEPAYLALPDLLKEQNYQNTTGGVCSWQLAKNTTLDFFPWAKQHEEVLKPFQQLMSVPREDTWLNVMPIDDLAAATSPERTFFVDIGGNIGHQCARLTTRHPQLQGRVILEDRPETIACAAPITGVEFKPHDFFTPQPVKGARFYYLRAILHDWEDDKGSEILKQIIPAMEPDSQILIDDVAIPNTGVHWWPSGLDMQMLVMHGALERDYDQWQALLDRAGLELVEIKPYSQVMANSLVIAQLKKN